MNLIYSEANPNYVQLLISDHDIKKFKGTQQRMLEPRDLIRLINDDRKTVDKKLNHILRGWEFDEEQKVWTNKDKNLAMWQDEDAVFLLTREPVMFTYPRKFVELGFTQTNENERFQFKQKEKLFDSDKYGVSIELKMEGNGLQYLVKVWKK